MRPPYSISAVILARGGSKGIPKKNLQEISGMSLVGRTISAAKSSKFLKGIYLSTDQKNNAKILLEEIILSKNKFYSILALNTITEKNLILDHKRIIDYMILAEDIIETNDQKELLLFKKGLYLIKNSKNLEGEKILKDLIKKNSQLKFLAEEIIVK